jgi:very-short-patch-repair endonuclease
MDTTNSSRIARFRPYCSAGVQRKLHQATGLPPADALRKLLEDEPNIKAISLRTGINRTQIYQALAFFDIEPPIYNHGAYMRQWYDEQPPDTGQRLTAEAHRASKGQSKPREYLLERAKHNQETRLGTEGERRVMAVLHEHGIPHTPQLAVDIFNIDIALPDRKLAIEVNGGNWHTTQAHQAGDTKKRAFLEAEGWTVIYLWGKPARIEHQARDLVASLQSAHDPPP